MTIVNRSIQHRCPNMRDHVDPTNIGGPLLNVPCPDCYSLEVTAIRLPYRPVEPERPVAPGFDLAWERRMQRWEGRS